MGEDTQKLVHNYKEQIDKMNGRIRTMKRTTDELEEELSQTKQRYRRALREKDEIEETSTYSRVRRESPMPDPKLHRDTSMPSLDENSESSHDS